MRTRWNDHRTEDPVRSEMSGRLAINRDVPPWIIVDLRENSQLITLRLRLVHQPIGTIALQLNGRCGISRRRESFQLIRKSFVHHRFYQWIQRIQGSDLRIRILHDLHLIHKPSITKGKRIP